MRRFPHLGHLSSALSCFRSLEKFVSLDISLHLPKFRPAESIFLTQSSHLSPTGVRCSGRTAPQPGHGRDKDRWCERSSSKGSSSPRASSELLLIGHLDADRTHEFVICSVRRESYSVRHAQLRPVLIHDSFHYFSLLSVGKDLKFVGKALPRIGPGGRCRARRVGGDIRLLQQGLAQVLESLRRPSGPAVGSTPGRLRVAVACRYRRWEA